MFNYLFAIRPSTVCNMNCSYCYRHDNIAQSIKMTPFNIDSMIYHSKMHPNNLFNFCGYGETMMHPQFDDIIIELSKITKVNWITNDTMFNTKKFENIISNATLNNIHDIVISIHIDDIKDIESYITNYYNTLDILTKYNIRVHTTTIVTDSNADKIIAYKEFFPDLVVKLPFPEYVQHEIIQQSYTHDITLMKLIKANLRFTQDVKPKPPYIGLPCTCGSKILEVHSDGTIYDCYYDDNKVIIGNINIQSPIKSITNRICNTINPKCIPLLRNEYKLVN